MTFHAERGTRSFMQSNKFTSKWLTAVSPLIIGHRGASAYKPENTMASFQLAVKQGADGVEFDVRLSADGQVIVIHDALVDRTTDGHGTIAEMTLAQIREFDAGDGERIPTLAELFETMGDNLLYNIEIKDYQWRNRGLETAVSALIHQHNLQDQVIISTFSPIALRRAQKAAAGTIPTALCRREGYTRYMHHFADGEADHPNHTMVDEQYMAWAKKRGYRTNTWTVNDPAEAQRLAKLGVHGIITNTPDIIRKVV